MASPGAAIQAFCEPVTTRSTPQASISNGTAPRPDTLSTTMSASGAASRMAAARTGIGFITPVEVSLWVSSTARKPGRRLGGQGRPDLGRVGGLAPFDRDLGHVRAVGRGDLGEAVAERADRHREDPVAGRQDVDHGGLEPTGARARQDGHVAGRAEVGLHAGHHPLEHRRELRPAVVDHLAGTGLADAGRQGRSVRGSGGWARSGSRAGLLARFGGSGHRLVTRRRLVRWSHGGHDRRQRGIYDVL